MKLYFGETSGQFAERFLALYPPTNEVHVIRKQIVHLVTDIVFGARSRFVARASAARVPNTYRYLFSRAPRIPALKQLGALHAWTFPTSFRRTTPYFAGRNGIANSLTTCSGIGSTLPPPATPTAKVFPLGPSTIARPRRRSSLGTTSPRSSGIARSPRRRGQLLGRE